MRKWDMKRVKNGTSKSGHPRRMLGCYLCNLLAKQTALLIRLTVHRAYKIGWRSLGKSQATWLYLVAIICRRNWLAELFAVLTVNQKSLDPYIMHSQQRWCSFEYGQIKYRLHCASISLQANMLFNNILLFAWDLPTVSAKDPHTASILEIN